jgi:hypothetical protein
MSAALPAFVAGILPPSDTLLFFAGFAVLLVGCYWLVERIG